jgi:hypothetical protein
LDEKEQHYFKKNSKEQHYYEKKLGKTAKNGTE